MYNLLGKHTVSGTKKTDFSGTVEFKIPVSLPYVTEWENDEYLEEEILHNEHFYNIISRKIEKDTMYVQCRFSGSARDRFWKLVSSFDDHHPHEKKAGNVMKNLLKEYMQKNQRLVFFIVEWMDTNTYPDFKAVIHNTVPDLVNPPPNLA